MAPSVSRYTFDRCHDGASGAINLEISRSLNRGPTGGRPEKGIARAPEGLVRLKENAYAFPCGEILSLDYAALADTDPVRDRVQVLVSRPDVRSICCIGQ
ncbi:hypothetical protein Atai01_25060 [Amycolatopsis taiwanensis]|uniref:Uncharacterized protein n=1 Tax=Amycolatopsis taiwanensis TaxID=342230 RepID=A0A9W6VFV8_9PSEU|nr:hypothetical protein Atai01_25060 [Amycolatopsis taiwanensis]